MNTRFLLPVLSCIFLTSCKEKTEDKLIGKWQEVAVINPQLEATMQDQKVFADTVGSTTDSLQNMSLYGTTNIDTFRNTILANLDSFRKAQFFAIKATSFDFRRGGLIYINSDDGPDSSNWYLDEDGALILDEAKLKGTGGKIRMEILHISDTMLKLQFNEKYLTSTAVFKPVKS